MTTTFKQLQDEVLLALHGFGLSQPRASFLVNPVSATDLTWTLRDTADIDMGLAEIGGELVFIESVNRAAQTVTISPDGRGYYGTTAAAHAANTRLTFAPTWPRQRVKAALNDVILGVWPQLYGVGQVQFTYTPAVTTYQMPAGTEAILSVAADTLGPSRQQQQINRYHLDSVAPANQFATQASLTLLEAPAPGRTVTVTYKHRPTALTADGAAVTTSGLRESSRQLLMLGACAQLLSMMDASRLTVDAASADEVDERNQIGVAARLANQFQVRYEMEVLKEQERLKETIPPRVRRSY